LEKLLNIERPKGMVEILKMNYKQQSKTDHLKPMTNWQRPL
jgi:hypothetical protein